MPITQLIKAVAKSAAKGAAKNETKKRVRDRTREYARNKARRALNRLEKQLDEQSGKTALETKEQIKTLRDAINNSFYDRKTKDYKVSIDKLTNIGKASRERIEKFERFLHTDTEATNIRKTRQMENYFKSASLTELQRINGERRTPEQRLARLEQQYFYRKTQTIWQGNTTPDDRNNYIVDVLRTNKAKLESGRIVQNLPDAVQYIKEKFSNEYPTMQDVMSNPNLGESFNIGSEYEDISPDTLNYSEWKALGVKL